MDMISFIVPAYNAERTIAKCIDSILGQDYTNYEIIVIDDGSTDNTLSILEEYIQGTDKISILKQANYGVSCARNLGIEKAKGEWITFVDSDDYLSTSYISEFLPYLKSNDEIIIAGIIETNGTNEKCYSNYCEEKEIIGDKKKELVSALLDCNLSMNKNASIAFLGYPFSKLYKASLLKDIRFPTNIKLREDALFNIEAFNCAKGITLSNKHSYYVYKNEWSATGKFRENCFEELSAYLVKANEFCKKYDIDVNSYYIAITFAYMSWLKWCVFHKKSGYSTCNQLMMIRESFNKTLWTDGFKNVEQSKISKQYKVLRWFFLKKHAWLIYLLFKGYSIIFRKRER